MAASVLFACGLNESKLPPYVHISEESDVDGNFLISCILGQRLRISNAGVLLICLQNNLKHYFNAGMRLGYNANIFVGKTLQVIDPLSCIASQEAGGGGLQTEWLTAGDDGEYHICEMLLTAIETQLCTNFATRNSTTILIDNLSILMNLGASKEALARFCFSLNNLTKKHENLSVVTKLGNCDIYTGVDMNIAKLGNIRLRVVKLKSGVFREVDGKLLIERENNQSKTQDENVYENNTITKDILFKINDRNIKIYNPGEV